MNRILLIYFCACFMLFACAKNNTLPALSEPTLLKVAIASDRFIDSDGTHVFPWGLNYTNAEDGVGLIDDHWFDETIWQTILADFLEMKYLGANIVRIHLQYNKFMLDLDTPNEAALGRLKELVEFAEENGIYLDITGLGAYRKSDQPAFYEDLGDELRWNTQALFWASIADRVGSSAAVFAFNLMNEPVVSVGCDINKDCDWLPGDGFGGFHFVQNISRNQSNQYAETMKNWIGAMTRSIRAKDIQTPITVGFLDLGNYNRFASELDYLSPHIYPKSGEIENAISRLMNNQSTVPIVIEEIYNLYCSIAEVEEFLQGIDGQYQGLMGHYSGRPLELLNDNDISHALRRNFLQFFQTNNPN